MTRYRHESFTLTTDPDLIDFLAPNPTAYREALARAERERNTMDQPTEAPPAAPPELVIRLKIAPQKGGVFVATAALELEGEHFEGSGTDGNAHGAAAGAKACAAVLLSLSDRWRTVAQLGPDVVVRRKSRRLINTLDQLFRPYDLPPRQLAAPPEISGHQREHHRVPDRARPVTGELVDDRNLGDVLGGDDDDDGDGADV